MNDTLPPVAEKPTESSPAPALSDPKERFRPRFAIRLAIAFSVLFILAGLGVCGYIFGILMFTFSLDAANPTDIPQAVELAMLLGWPATIVIAALVPPILFAWWPRLWLMIPGILLSLALPFVWFLVNWIIVILRVSN